MRVDAFKPSERLCKRQMWRTWLLMVALAVIALALASCQTDALPPAPDQPTARASEVAQQTAAPEGQDALRPATTAATTTPTACGAIPAGWVEYVVDIGDTLSGLAERTGLAVEEIQRANCLTSDELFATQRLWLPPLPAATPTPCVIAIPPGWGGYLVRAGDTLASLAAVRGLLPEEIARVNCLTSAQVAPGSLILLPPIILAPAPPAAAGPTQPSAPVMVAPAQPALAAPAGLATGSATPAAGSDEGGASPVIRQSAFLAPPNAPTLLYPVGDPNQLETCPTPNGPAHITKPLRVTRGERAHFFFCGFADVASLNARINSPTGPSDSPDPSILLFTPNHLWRTDLAAGRLDPELGSLQKAAEQFGYQGVVTWYPPCQQPPGEYELILEAGSGSSPAPVGFRLRIPAGGRNQIMVAPKMDEPGSTFDIYYCDYPAQTAVRILLYHADATQRVYGDDGTITGATPQLRDFWIIRTNSDGWAHERIRFAPNVSTGMYYVCDSKKLESRECDQAGDTLNGNSTFWLFP